MIAPLSVVICLVFAALGLWHVYWAVGGSFAKEAAIPKVMGKPAFVPSRAATLAVAGALFASAVLVALTSGLLRSALPRSLLTWLSYGLALVLFARAIGDFRLVGFFKRIRGSRFATLDTLAYSPLCLTLAIGILIVTQTRSQ